ncbi:Bet1-like protein [Zea mays]|uniref:Bet1-like protein n=2 Tax=Zea mays TaxID=4577 RepID=A0A8J8XN75_MAIZE|nr:Bet1-like protein [Zea mays]PWZ12607.1 Bet1-like protein [Zea mays]
MAHPMYGSGPLRSRNAASSDEIQLRIDPVHGDLDEEIDGLHSRVRMLKGGPWLSAIFELENILVGVAQEINSEAKFQNDFLHELQMTLAKAQAGVKNNMRRLNKSIIQQGSNHVLYVVLFALFCFFIVYLLSKFSRR